MAGTPEQIAAARNAWLAEMAAHEEHRLKVNRLWLEYLELADPARARKFRRLLKCDLDAGATVSEPSMAAAKPRGASMPRPQRKVPSLDRLPPAPAVRPGGAGQTLPFE